MSYTFLCVTFSQPEGIIFYEMWIIEYNVIVIDG
jgi:hypothetical protein